MLLPFMSSLLHKLFNRCKRNCLGSKSFLNLTLETKKGRKYLPRGRYRSTHDVESWNFFFLWFSFLSSSYTAGLHFLVPICFEIITIVYPSLRQPLQMNWFHRALFCLAVGVLAQRVVWHLIERADGMRSSLWSKGHPNGEGERNCTEYQLDWR